MKKTHIIIAAVILFVGLGGIGVAAYIKKHPKKPNKPTSRSATRRPQTEEAVEEKQVPATIRLVATGDMIAHDSVLKNAKKPDGNYDFLALMSTMKPFFEKADVRFCNQATPAGGEQFELSGYPSFNAPLAFTEGMVSVGCNVVNIGTNHTNDKGQALIDATVAGWDNRQTVLAVAGANRSAAEQSKIRYFTVKGMKFAFLSYTTYSNNNALTPHGINMYSDAAAQAQLAEARQNAQFVIVSMRWGTEYGTGVNAQQDAIAQTLANAGADIILGHGPHVLEPVKKLIAADGREVHTWFSLGNFLNTQLEVETLVGGFAVMDIDTTTKKVTNLSFMPVYMHYEWTPAQKASQDLLARTNLQMVPLDQATELLAKSQNGTTVQAQTDRVKSVLNQFTPVQIITSGQY